MSKSSKKQESLKKKHWSIKSQETLISRNRDGHFCLNVEGGAEVGLFPLIGEIRQDRIHYNRGKIHPGELILSVNNKRVPGMIKKDVIALIKRSANPVSLVTVRQNATITRDIRQYLATRFTKTSVDSELQHQIRENLHMRVVPCTTRSPQPGERHGIDYNFISVDEFKHMEKNGDLLESGVYEGNYYGTPRPPSDPPSTSNFPAYARSPASMGYSKEGVISSNTTDGPPGWGGGGAPPPVANIPKNLGPLPPNWEIAYTENNEKYFIDHSTGTTHWLDPRLARYLKHSVLECSENELPYGWEKVNDPAYGTYYIDHINRVTQYENPILEAKRKHAGDKLLQGSSHHQEQYYPPAREPPPSFHSTAALEKQREAEAAQMWPDAGLRDYNDAYPYPYPNPPSDQELEADLQGQPVTVNLQKTSMGFGFTIIGGDRPGELLQIKSIVAGSVAERDGRLMVGDVLVRINGISVLTYSHRKVVELFQSLQLNSDVAIEVRRGYPLPDSHRPIDELPSYNDSRAGYGEPPQQGERVMVNIVKGPLGFGFSLGESALGPIVKLIMDHPRCAQLQEGDVLLEVNGENVQDYPHTSLVEVLKRCPKGNQASFLVLRQLPQSEENLPVYPEDGYSGQQGGDEPFTTLEIRLMRQVSGFGFRIIGGREEGSQATVGAIVAGGAADVDGRLLIGDEITHINHHSVMDASHRDVISLMGQAAALGEVTLGIQRKMPMPDTLSPTSGVAGGGFGASMANTEFDHLPKQDLGASGSSGGGGGGGGASEVNAQQGGQQQGGIPKGVREVTVQRPNMQTSFGFVLQSNTLRPGCMICRLIPGSPAERSQQLYIHDELLAVNGKDVSRMDHGDIVTLIKASSTQIHLAIQQPEDIDAVTRQQMMSEQQGGAPQVGNSPHHSNTSPHFQHQSNFSPQHQQGGAPHGGRGSGYQDQPDGGYVQDRRQGFQDFPGGEEEQHPQISADLSDIASDDEEIHNIEIRRLGGGFGFSIRGGAEYNSPLCVLRIADGGAAEKDGRLRVGDELLDINGNSTENMLHSDAITIIKHGGEAVKLIVRRLADEMFMGSGRHEEVVFSPTAVQTKDQYAQEYMNSLNRNTSRDSSRDPHSRSPPAQ